jgi:hypothetical protein
VAAPTPGPRPPGIEALTLSDLPSVTDLLDLVAPTAQDPTLGSTPLADDDDDAGLFIEAPALPEPPDAGGEDIAFLLEDEDMLPPAGPETEALLASAMTGFDRAFDLGPVAALPEADLPTIADFEPEPVPDAFKGDPERVKDITTEPVQTAMEPAAVRAAEPQGALIPTPAEPGHAPNQGSVPSAPATEPHSRPTGPLRADPLAALASLRLATRQPVARPKTIDHRDAINSLMGELTQAGRSGLPSVLRLDVPSDLEDHEIEVVVQLRRQGEVLVEGMIHRPLPGKGSTSKLSVEFKRS